MSHYAQLVVELTILVLAVFLGVEVISKVPTCSRGGSGSWR